MNRAEKGALQEARLMKRVSSVNIWLLHRSRNPGRSPHPLCGISMHASLVVTSAGLRLGLSAVKFWTRKIFKGTNPLKRRVPGTISVN